MMQGPTNAGNIGGSHPANNMSLQRRQQRQLQQSDNESLAGSIPTTTTIPDVPTTIISSQRYVSLYWSMVLLQGESPQPQNADSTFMADWLLDGFLCTQEKVWMGNALNLLRNDCLIGENTVDFGTISDSHDIILWNKPTVDWYTEQLEYTEGVQYEVWTVQYPLFTNWVNGGVEEHPSDPTDEDSSTQIQTPQEKLQTLLEDQIRNGQLQSDRGVASILGRELETYWLFRSSPNVPKLPPLLVPGLEGQETLDDLPGSLQPYNGQVLVIIGALLALIHTLGLLLLHFVVRPGLMKRAAKQRQQKSEGEPQKAEMSRKSEDDLSQSFNNWLGGQQQHPQLLHQNVYQRHYLQATKLLLSAQMPDDDSHHSDLLSSIGYVSTEEEEDIEVVSLLSSSTPKSAIKPSNLLDPPGQSSSTQRLLDPPPSLLSKPVGGTNLLAPMSSYFYGYNSRDGSQKSLPRSSRNSSQKSYEDEESVMVFHC